MPNIPLFGNLGQLYQAAQSPFPPFPNIAGTGVPGQPGGPVMTGGTWGTPPLPLYAPGGPSQTNPTGPTPTTPGTGPGWGSYWPTPSGFVPGPAPTGSFDPFQGLGSLLTGNYRGITGTSYPSFQMPYILQMLQDAQRLYQRGGPQAYTGPTTAPLSGPEMRAGQWLENIFPQMTGQYGAANEAWMRALNLPGNISSSPEMAALVRSAVNPIIQQLTEQALPYVRSGARATGGTGGTRQSLAESLALERFGRQALDTSATMYGNAWQNAWGTAMQALGMGPQTQGMAVAPAAALSAWGGQQRAITQADLEQRAANYYYNQYMPYQTLMEYANLIRSPYGQLGFSSYQVPQAGTAQTAAGLGLTALPWLLRLFGIGG